MARQGAVAVGAGEAARRRGRPGRQLDRGRGCSVRFELPGLLALFILGPERLPAATGWLGRVIWQVKDYAAAREHLEGPKHEQLREPFDRGPSVSCGRCAAPAPP